MADVNAIAEDELDQLTMVISAAEDWAKTYSKHPDSHAKVLKTEAKLARLMRKHFKTLAQDRIWKYINWAQYHTELIKAFDINVIFDEDNFFDDEGALLTATLHDPLLDGMGNGIEAGQAIYNRDIGMTTNQASVLKAAGKYSNQLVTGINQTTRDRLQQSIATSLGLGEDQSAAAARIADIINDPKRAEVIARTEAVNSYNKGLMAFAGESNAVGKVWQDVGAEDECATNSDDGQVAIDDTFSSGDDAPPAHPNCRCGMQLIYDNGTSDDSSDDTTDE